MNKERLAQLLKTCTDSFFLHPEWDSMVELMRYHFDLENADRVTEKDLERPDAITELKARLLTAKKINNFIEDTIVLKKAKETVPKTNRKFR